MKATIRRHSEQPQSAVRAGLTATAHPGATRRTGQGTTGERDGAARGLLEGVCARGRAFAAPRNAHDHTYGDQLRTRGAVVVLVAALASGPAALAWLGSGAGSARAHAPAAAAPSTIAPGTGMGQSAGAYAADFVVAWLTSTRSAPDPVKQFMTAPELLPLKASSASNVQVASYQQVQPRLWSVRVSATVTAPGTAPMRRTYQVAVLADHDGLRVGQVPALVAGPAQADRPMSLGYLRTVQDHDVIASCQGFLNGLLVGNEDIARYTTPGQSIQAVTPPAYTAVKVAQVQATEDVPAALDNNTRLRVWVQATGVDAAGATTSLTYPLTLAARDGRWEISAIDPAAVVDGPTSSAGTGPAATPEASATGAGK